jgi:hypothetical protein
MRERRTTSSGMTNCLASDSACSVRESAATSSNIEQAVAHVAYTIGLHGAWAPETARREAKVQLGRVAGGDDPVEDRQLDHNAITVRELCSRYLADLQAGLILGKGGRPKKASTITTDTGRIERHIIPLPQQGPQGHHGRKDAGFGQDQEAAGEGHRPRRRWNGHAHRRSSWWHPYLRHRSGYYRKQPGPWHPQAEGQRAEAPAKHA